MKNLQQRSIVLSVGFLLALVGVLAADYRLSKKNLANEKVSKIEDAKKDGPTETQTTEAIAAQAIGQIDPRMIAGGGGTSTGGSFRVDGTVGQTGASTTMTGGTFTVNGGFWNAISAQTTSTPTPTPTPTSSPTPTPLPLQLLLEESGPVPNQAVAVDSSILLRDPFLIVNPAHPFTPEFDPNTRITIFVANLQLTPGQPPSSVTVNLVDSNNQSYDTPAEDVRLVPGFTFVQVMFRLPSNLPAGSCTITVKTLNAVSNIGTIGIRI